MLPLVPLKAVLQPVDLAAKAVQLHVPASVLQPADLRVLIVLHLVPLTAVLQPADLRMLIVLHPVPLTAVLQPVVQRVLAVATNVAAMTPVKSLS